MNKAISISTGPIFTIFSPNGRYLREFYWSGIFPIPQGTLQWQPILCQNYLPPPCTYRSDIQKRNGITPCICMISLNSATNATVIDIQQTLHLSELCELTSTYWGRNFCWRIFTTFNRGLRHLKKRKSEKKVKYILNTAIVNTLVWMFGVTMVILQTEFKQALQTAQTKVVIVDFFANWCTPCRLLAPKLKVCIFSVHLCSLHFPYSVLFDSEVPSVSVCILIVI